MGYIAHNIIVVISWSEALILAAHEEAKRIFPWISPISPDTLNGYRSFFVPPDGSKEGWSESDAGDARRGEFKAWLQSQQYSDGSGPLEWVEVRLGEGYGDRNMVDCNHPEKGTELHSYWRKQKPSWARRRR